MKRRDELVVGATIVVALAVIAAGTVWLSDMRIGSSPEKYTARFQTVGALGAGDPVVYRGVRVGRVEGTHLADGGWVEADLTIYAGVPLPERAGIIAASRSFFGEWQATIISLDEPPDDPNVRQQLQAVLATGADDGAWPGATLPDVGQLTAQASRVAGDIASISSRVETVFDSQAVVELQEAIRDFTGIASSINEFTETQTGLMGDVGINLRQGSDVLADAARRLQASLLRVDEATDQGELETIITNSLEASQQARDALEDFRAMVGMAREHDSTLVRLIQGADSLMTRLERGTGTIGMLLGDSVLYHEATLAVRQLRELLADIQANPRKYFKFSVF